MAGYEGEVNMRERRSFINGGLTSLAAMAAGTSALSQDKPAQDKPAPLARFEPAHHAQDDWLDELPGKHRLVFDATNADGVSDALLFGNNYLRVNRADYGLQDKDLAVVIVVRHRAAPFGVNDAMWAKYTTALADHASYEDPKTKQAPKVNVFNAAGRGNTLEALSKRGVVLAVCASATRAVAGAAAKESGGNADTIYAELTANLVSNARIVPAGIVAVNRAQERGYSLVRA